MVLAVYHALRNVSAKLYYGGHNVGQIPGVEAMFIVTSFKFVT